MKKMFRHRVALSIVVLVSVPGCGTPRTGGISLDIQVSASDRAALQDGVVTREEQHAAARAGMACYEAAGITPVPVTESDGALNYGARFDIPAGQDPEVERRRNEAVMERCDHEHHRTVSAVYKADHFHDDDDTLALTECLRSAGVQVPLGATHSRIVLALADSAPGLGASCLEDYERGDVRD